MTGKGLVERKPEAKTQTELCVHRKKAVYLGKRIPALEYIRDTIGNVKPKGLQMAKEWLRKGA